VRNKKRLGVYAGSFDPLTIGHLWMIEQGVSLFDRLIVAVGINPEKRCTFSLEEQVRAAGAAESRGVDCQVAIVVPMTIVPRHKQEWRHP